MFADRAKDLFDRAMFWGGAASFAVAVVGTLWPL